MYCTVLQYVQYVQYVQCGHYVQYVRTYVSVCTQYLVHLAPYIPYKLQVIIHDIICEVEGIDLHTEDTIIAERVNFKFTEVKPILKPLSDLNEKVFRDIFKGTKYTYRGFHKSIGYSFKLEEHPILYHLNVNVLEWEYIYLIELVKRHFDVFGLIAKKLALDINKI